MENADPERSDDYISVGLTEDLIAALSRIDGLRVVPRVDVLPFRNRDLDARKLGESLFVQNILDGSFRKGEGRIQLSLRLTEVQSGRSLWTDVFDHPIEDIFTLQSKVITGVATTLGVPPQGAIPLPNTDVEAYDAYLRARQLLAQRGAQKADTAIRYLEKVITVDPRFAPAYTAMADAYSSMYTYYDGDDEWLSRIVKVSEQALAIDPGLTEAQFSVGLVNFHKKAFEDAKGSFRKVTEMRPFHYDAHWWLGIIADLEGDYGAALEAYETCAAIKPYSIEPWLYMNMTHRRRGNTDQALQSARRFLEVGIRSLEVSPNDAVTLSRFAVVYTLFGDHEKARAVLDRAVAAGPEDGLVLYNCAATYALLGDAVDALSCLRSALENGFRNVLEWVKTDPDFDRLRRTESFDELLDEFTPKTGA